jgi:hypothetical protein
MIHTTSSQAQQPEQTTRSPQSEQNILNTVTCTLCDAAYAPSPAHLGLSQAPPGVLETAFMSMCHFCFRCRRPACPACWDTVHGVCGACVQEAHLPFRVDAAPLNGVIFSPLHQADTAQENTSSPPLVCVRPGHFQTNASLSTHPLKALPAVPAPAQLGEESQAWFEKEAEERSKSTTQTSVATPSSLAEDSAVAKEPGTGARFIKVLERLVTVILIIILLAIAVMIILAEVSSTANTQILRLFNVDIRYEIAYLIALIKQIKF